MNKRTIGTFFLAVAIDAGIRSLALRIARKAIG